MSSRDGGDEVTDEFLVTDLVLVVIVVGVSGLESVGGLAFSGNFVEVLANLVDFGGLLFSIIVVVVVLVLVLLEAGGDASRFGEGLLEEVVR